mgnify:CR=1 FL=1|jgi:hypothetical protein
MVDKLTDDQKDLIMAILYDLDNVEASEDKDIVNIKSYLTTIYNSGKYDSSQKIALNTIREFWMTSIYNKGYSTWDYIRESPV